MSNQARIEELSDSDPDEMDIDALVPPTSLSSSSSLPPSTSLMNPSAIPSTSSDQPILQPQARGPTSQQTLDRERTKHWQCLYPVYFDASKSRAEGRRVGKGAAVMNPLAREMCDAVASLGLNVVFEPGKCHPRDWANPGRVRVLVKEDGSSVAKGVENKHQLYTLVSTYLQAHPTTENSPKRLRVAGLNMPEKIPPVAVPRGWKMNKILPLHSPALSGGGVSDNMLGDMMKELQAAGGGGSGSAVDGPSAGGDGKKGKKGR